MAVQSQRFKEEVYPSDFDDDMKFMYDDLMVQFRLHFPHIAQKDEWVLKMATRVHIREQTGKTVKLTEEEVVELKEQYKLKNNLFETTLPESFYENHPFNNKEYEILE